MLDAADLRNLLRDEEFGPFFSAFLEFMRKLTSRARLDAKSRDAALRAEAVDFLVGMGLPVEVKKPVKRLHRGWR